MCSEIGLEIRDVSPEAEDVLYCFIGAPHTLSLGKVEESLQYVKMPGIESKKIIELLLWYGFLGVVHLNGGEEVKVFIYDVQYDLRKLKKLARDLNDNATPLCIHKAFWPFLEITGIQ